MDYLENSGKRWQYEPRFFELSNGKRYTPDFFLPDEDLWIDVKGHLNDVSREKMELFQKSGKKLLIADGDVLMNQFGLDLTQSRLDKRFNGVSVGNR